MIRFLDDWAYQANIRVNGQTPDIGELMKPYEEKLSLFVGGQKNVSYSYPWKRSFEIEVCL